MQSKGIIAAATLVFGLTFAGVAAADVEERLDRKGDRINARLDRRAEHALENGHEQRAERLDRRGDRINHRLDHRGRRISHRREHRQSGGS